MHAGDRRRRSLVLRNPGRPWILERRSGLRRNGRTDRLVYGHWSLCFHRHRLSARPDARNLDRRDGRKRSAHGRMLPAGERTDERASPTNSRTNSRTSRRESLAASFGEQPAAPTLFVSRVACLHVDSLFTRFVSLPSQPAPGRHAAYDPPPTTRRHRRLPAAQSAPRSPTRPTRRPSARFLLLRRGRAVRSLARSLPAELSRVYTDRPDRAASCDSRIRFDFDRRSLVLLQCYRDPDFARESSGSLFTGPPALRASRIRGSLVEGE